MEVLMLFCLVCVSVCGLATMTTFFIIGLVMPDLPRGDTEEMCLPKLHSDSAKGDITCGPVTNILSEYLKSKAALSYEALLKAYYGNEGEETHESRIELKYFTRFQKSDMRPRARIVAKRLPNDIEDNSPELTPFNHWHDARKHMKHGGFRQYGVKIRNGRLLVPVAGLYDVYSFFVFEEPCKNGEPDIRSFDKPLKHAIFKFDILEGKEREIVSSVQPHKLSVSKHYNLYDSYMSSVVRLRAGDELSVKVSNITYLTNPFRNYFGITLI